MYQSVDGRVYVCLTYTQVIHTIYTLFANIIRLYGIIAHFVNIQGVMTRVYVVYVFGKHIHAFKLLIFSINRSVFRGRVYVWRLILKKNASP